MAEKDTGDWGVYDWLDVAEYNRWNRRCPKCGGDDVKYATHNKAATGRELSVHCNACGYGEAGNNSGSDAERLVRDWHDVPDAGDTHDR